MTFLNRKNNNSSNTNENQIFTKDYYKLYEIFFKLEQSKIAQFIQNNIENNNNFINQNMMNMNPMMNQMINNPMMNPMMNMNNMNQMNIMNMNQNM